MAYGLGLIFGIATAVSQPKVQKTMSRNGIYGTSEAESLELMEVAFLPQNLPEESSDDPLAKAHLVTGFEPGKFVKMFENGLASDYSWPSDSRHGMTMQTIEDLALGRTTDENIVEASNVVKDASPAEARLLIMKMIIKRFSKLLFVANNKIDPEKIVSYCGMDSMIAAELRNRLWKIFGLEVPFLDLLDAEMKMKDLAEKAVEAKQGIDG